jgi:hypothetical protein
MATPWKRITIERRGQRWEGRYTLSGYGGTIIVECQGHLTSALLDDRLDTMLARLLGEFVDEIEAKS